MQFVVPMLFIKKPLYLANGSNSQQVVDKPNSAALLKWRNFIVVADHASDEGMWRLQYAIPNRTTCQIIDDTNKAAEYICIKKQRGQIIDGKMYDAAHVQINNYKSFDLCVYTCTGRKFGKATEVWLTYWKRR